MSELSREILRRLGRGEPIEQVGSFAGMSKQQFHEWWKKETHARALAHHGDRQASVGAEVEIRRDRWGIPHVRAQTDDDLFFGFGYALAQDRLFQLDYLRRKAAGTLSEVLGKEGWETDLVARVLDFRGIAEAEWKSLDAETRGLIEAYSRGINLLIASLGDLPPIEFDLLDYRPAPWTPLDCLLVTTEFRWYLTGRFPVLTIPELAKRTLGEGDNYRAFLRPESGEEAILPPGSYPSRTEPIGDRSLTGCDPANGLGSNNWVVAGSRSSSGMPLLASDPHIAFGAVSCWHEVHLTGGSFDVAGMGYVGIPAVMFGRNRHVAWGCTNNICSLRDLYLEKEDPAFPNSFEFDGGWEQRTERKESVQIRGEGARQITVLASRNGPIVNEILPVYAGNWGPISLRWQGQEPCGWLQALYGMNRATTAGEFDRATRPWRVPTFSLVYADVDGEIGYRCTGRLPLRRRIERGLRRGWTSDDQWTGSIPSDEMPSLLNPPRGWIATANNRVAADEFPYPLSGTWSSGQRAARIRELLESKKLHDRDSFAAMHQDALSIRARECVPPLLAILREREPHSPSQDSVFCRAVAALADWNGVMAAESVAAAIFDTFFANFGRAVAAARFPESVVSVVAGAIGGLVAGLIQGNGAMSDPLPNEVIDSWFPAPGREAAITRAYDETLQNLTERFGPDVENWQWGAIHELQRRHVLSGVGDLGSLLDIEPAGVRGDMVTVCNTGADDALRATTGAGYRMIVDLDDPAGSIWAVDVGSQSGHPGSENYADQRETWLTGEYHELPLDWDRVKSMARQQTRLTP